MAALLTRQGHWGALSVASVAASNCSDCVRSGQESRGYLSEDCFASGIKVTFHDFVHSLYPQLQGEFLPGRGIVDHWLNSRDPSA